MLHRLKIDPEFQSKIPPLTFEEQNLLQTNILEEGRLLSPLIVWNGLIVDGHNRFAILKQHPEIQYTILEKDFANRYEAVAWICKNQLGRRNLTPEQRKYLIGKRYEAEKNASFNRGNQYTSPKKSGSGQNDLSHNNETTRERIGRETNTSDGYVKRAELFAKAVDTSEKAVPGIRAKILSGEIKPTAAELSAVSSAPPEERPALVAEMCKPKNQRTTETDKKSSTKEEISKAILPAPVKQPVLQAESLTRPVASKEAVKIDDRKLKEMAANRYHVERLADGSDMLCEIEAAASDLMERWEQMFRYYPDILESPENRADLGAIVQNLMTYLKKVEDKTI